MIVTPRAISAGASPQPADRLPLSICVGWGLGTLSMSLMLQSTSLFILKFLVDHVGIAAATAGMLIGFGKIYDAIIDPTLGNISDRTRTRWGRRRPYLLLGAMLSAVSFVLVFHLAAFRGSDYLVFIVAFALLLNATGYSVFNIPYLAMPPEMTNNFHERTKLISFRAAAVAAGGLLASAVGPVLVEIFGGGVTGHVGMSWVLGSVILIAGLACIGMTWRAPMVRELEQTTASFREQFRTAVQNRPFVLLLYVKLFHLFGLSIFLSSLPFLFTSVLGLSYSYLGLYFLVQNVFTFVSQPFWVWFCRVWGKNRGYYLAALLYGGAFISWLLASPGETAIGVALRAALMGVGAGGVLLVGQSLLPDTMQYDFQRTGLRREGVFAGVYTTVEALSFALGPALAGVLLSAAGYVAAQGPAAAGPQPESVRLAIYACASILPCIGITLAALVMTRYKLTEQQLRQPG